MKLNQLKKCKDDRACKKNPVAKNVRSGLNKSVTMKDRKKAEKNPRKNTKHKGKAFESPNPLDNDQTLV
jgi:hypothetical protein